MISRVSMTYWLSLGVFFSAVPGTAAADETGQEPARKHFENGLVLMQTEDYAGAAAEFEASVKLLPTKNGLFNLANCYKALHRYGDALKTVDQLRARFKNDLDNEWLTEIDTFEKTLKGIIAALFVQVNEEGATILVDGVLVGTSPMADALLVGPGDHEITVAKEGFSSLKRTVKLVSGKKNIEHFELEIAATQLTINANVAGATVTVDGEPIGPTPIINHPLTAGEHLIRIEHAAYQPLEKRVVFPAGKTTTTDVSLLPLAERPTDGPVEAATATPKKKHVGSLVSFAVGGAAGIGAIVTGALHLSKTNRIKDSCTGNTCPKNLKSDGDTAHALAVATNVLIPVGATGIVLGIVMLLIENRSKPEAEAPVAVVPLVGSSMTGLAISGRF